MKPDLNKMSRPALIRYASQLRLEHKHDRHKLRECQTRLRKIERVCESETAPTSVVTIIRGLADYSTPAGKED